MPADEVVPLDAEQIFKELARNNVDYVLVGGLAVQTHGHIRTTIDIDIFPRPDPINLEQLAEALNVLGARILNEGSENLEISGTLLPQATLWQFMTLHGAIDVLHDAPGAPPYSELRKNALEVELDDVKIAVVGLDDLINMKRASGRPIDLEDLSALTAAD